jgi:hypothetical protein
VVSTSGDTWPAALPNAIDPNLVVAGDGSATLTWGSWGIGIFQTLIDPATGFPAGHALDLPATGKDCLVYH